MLLTASSMNEQMTDSEPEITDHYWPPPSWLPVGDVRIITDCTDVVWSENHLCMVRSHAWDADI